MNVWERYAVFKTVNRYRDGWLGVWDAFVAALLRRDRLQVPVDLTFSMYMKVPVDEVDCFALQIEEAPHEEGSSEV